MNRNQLIWWAMIILLSWICVSGKWRYLCYHKLSTVLFCDNVAHITALFSFPPQWRNSVFPMESIVLERLLWYFWLLEFMIHIQSFKSLGQLRWHGPPPAPSTLSWQKELSNTHFSHWIFYSFRGISWFFCSSITSYMPYLPRRFDSTDFHGVLFVW